MDVSLAGTGVLEIISGLYLTNSIIKIRKYFKETDSEDEMDSKVLLIHAGAFWIYLVVVIIYTGAQTVYNIYPHKNITQQIYDISVLIYIWGSFFSLILLAVIFWEFGKKEEEPE